MEVMGNFYSCRQYGGGIRAEDEIIIENEAVF